MAQIIECVPNFSEGRRMDVVDEISKVKTDQSEWPLQNIYLDVEIIK